MTRIVVTGAAGFIGSNIIQGLNARGITDIIAVDDLTQGDKFRNLADLAIGDYVDAADFYQAFARGAYGRVEAVFHEGACSDTMEHNGKFMMANNYATSLQLFEAAQAQNTRLLYASSAATYGGSRVFVEDPAHEAPLNVYGRSKLAGEQAVHAALPGANVVRTSWVYTGGAGTDFVAVMRRLAGTDRTVDVVDDQAGSPTYVKDLAAALLEIYERGIDAPILHAANDGALSRFEQAQAVFAELGEDPERVRPVSTAEVPRPAHRPVFSALSMVESADVGLTPLRPWRAALAEALATQIGDGPIPSTP